MLEKIPESPLDSKGVKVKLLVAQLCLFVTPWTVAHQALLCPRNFPGMKTGVGCHSLLQGIFLTQGLNPDLPHCRKMLYCLSHQGTQIPSSQPSLISLMGNGL